MSAKSHPSPFYSLDNIKKKKAIYNIIYGERSNGKSFAVLAEILNNFLKTGKQGAIVRRWADDIKGSLAQQIWDGPVNAGLLDGTGWESIHYQSGKFWLCKWDKKLNKRVLDNKPIAFAFAINTATRYKSTSYPDVTTILFDEFLDRNGYLPGEFVDFMSIVSTIVRHRTDVTIYMCGNTVNKFSCPYWQEMGLTKVKNQQQGTIDVYSYGCSDLKVAVEYCGTKPKEIRGSDKYFAFDNPRLQMITTGAWEMAMYPHCPVKYKQREIRFIYFIEWDGEILQCEVIQKEDSGDWFTFIHRKTTPYQDPEKSLIFTTEVTQSRNRFMRITQPSIPLIARLYRFFVLDKVFYQDNSVGEIVRAYLQFCKGHSIISA